VEITVTRKQDGQREIFRFEVMDTGIGIEPEQQEKLFSPFVQMFDRKKHPNDGTGLGVFLSQKLATMINGRLYCESEYGKGSVFTLELNQ
jgi:protein-histidine pros-kinase